MNEVPLRERRDFTPYFSERDKQIRETNLFIITMVLILLIAGIAYWLFVLTPTVKAESTIRYQDVHSLAAACSFAELYPEKVSNLKQLKANCK